MFILMQYLIPLFPIHMTFTSPCIKTSDAILCLGTQFNITDVQSSNKEGTTSKSSSKNKAKSLLATSESSKTLDARISSILGPKFLAGLTRMDIDLSNAVLSVSSSSGGEKTTNTNTNNNKGGKWRLEGLISYAPTSPHPTNARDLQFFSINGRPVDLPSVSRLLGDVWRLFDPSAETKGNGKGSASAGRRRCACILAFTLPNNMYDVNLSPDKREVMFTEETAMSDLIREGLMALWTSQSEGKFTANEVESQSNRSMNVRSVSAKKSDTKGIATEENKKVDDDDDETDNITPKLRRRNVGDDGTLVTPLDSNGPKKAKGKNCTNQAGDNDGVPSISQENNRQPKETTLMRKVGGNATRSQQEEEEITPPHHANYKEQHHQSQRGWSQMQLPERAREPDRRGWEQMRLNFQRIEKNQLHQDMERMLSSDDGGAEHIDNLRTKTKSTAISEQQTSFKSTQTSSNKASMSTESDSRRQPKRQKRNQKQDVTSFLDSFAFGAAKPATADANESDGNESHLSEDESETLNVQEIVENFSRRLSRQDKGQSNARMVIGNTMMTAEKPSSRTSLRNNAVVEEAFTYHQSQVGGGGEVDDEDDQSNESDEDVTRSPPIDAVWDHFSGTQNVIAQAQHARLTLQKNRKQLQSSVKRKRVNSIDDQDSKPSSNNDVEEDSTVNLCKEDFMHMSIIGQFNLGFILARCRNHNLWILDQHACDEKYNFERLCKETVIHEQKLIAPLPLELSPSEEHCVLENMAMFERNGFRFSYDPDKEPRHRLSLTALPHSGSGGDGKKAVQFGKEDVGALCSMLGADGTSSSAGYIAGFDTGVEGGRIAGVNAVRRYAGSSQSDGIVGSSIVRLPKAIAMFASRACRGSIMIGKALSHKEQVNILKKLDKTDIPWNCAHGRVSCLLFMSLLLIKLYIWSATIY